ncbi:hypothetical protein D1J63_27655 [Streptomyces sp. KPB2]|nr:hypothetical protein D1J63_27655 [Streptomyces sp. KPB2]
MAGPGGSVCGPGPTGRSPRAPDGAGAHPALRGDRHGGGRGGGCAARRGGVPLRPPVPPQRHDCPQRRRSGGDGGAAATAARLLPATRAACGQRAARAADNGRGRQRQPQRSLSRSRGLVGCRFPVGACAD